MNAVAIIVCAGKSSRMGQKKNKILLQLAGKPLVYYALKSFEGSKLISEIILVTNKNDEREIKEIIKRYGFKKIKKFANGWKERQDSVYNGLMQIKNAKSEDIVVIHNGSNPLVKGKEIAECIKAAKKYGAAAVGFRLKDTIKKVNNGFVHKTIDRTDVYQMQTPQAVKHGLLIKAFENANKKKLKATDDVSLVEALGKKVKIVPCSYENIKITTKDDLGIAESILMQRQGMKPDFRVGFGQDSHKFIGDKNKKLVLGGCVIDEIGFDADSDGDVILHALFNAISSAIGERSLGYYADQLYKNGITDSREYVKVILRRLNSKKLIINNISIMIEASKPKLEKHTENIKNSLSKILKLNKENIGITYTSGKSLTSFGQGRGMQCFVVVSLISI